MLKTNYEPSINITNEYIIDLFNNFIKNKCKICYIGFASNEKDSLLEKILKPYSNSIIVKTDYNIKSDDILNAYNSSESIIFNLIAGREMDVMDRLIDKLICKENMKSDKAEQIVFETIDIIIYYNDIKKCILDISKVDCNNKSIIPIIKYDFDNDKFIQKNII